MLPLRQSLSHRRRSANYAATVLTDGPVAYWRLGEASGTSAVDATGNGHMGTYNGTFGLGQSGALAHDTDTSAQFDGSTSYISAAPLATLATWTVEAWVKPNGNQGEDATILTDLFNSIGVNYVLCFDHDASSGAGTHPLRIFTGYYNGSWHISSGVDLISLSWSHVVGTYDGANIKLYVNGVLQSTVASASAPTSGGTGVRIGAWWVSVTNFSKGWIDEPAIYSSALSSTRILAHYNAGT